MSRFDGKTFLVVGASSGIGLASAQRLAQEGASIVAMARDSQRLDGALASLPGTGHMAIAGDASDARQCDPLVAAGKERGGYAGLVVAAGVHEVRPMSLLETPGLLASVNANVATALQATKALIKASRREGASVVWLSSIAAERATPGFFSYAASKGALVSACRVAAVELSARRIRVNTILAGVVETPMSSGWLDKLMPEQREAVAKGHLLGLGRVDDVAAAVAFLLSDDARWMTGSMMVVDGGLSVR